MANILSMPRLSDTMTEGVLVKWVKNVGDAVNAGDVVAEVETDKATMELECFEPGFVAAILVPAGKAAPVGNAIAIIAEEEGEDISAVLASLGMGGAPAPAAPAPAGVHASAPAAAPAHEAPAAVPAALATEVGGDGRLKASPLARKMASETGLALNVIPGSGPGGRIVKRDVEKALEAGATSAAQKIVVIPPTPAAAPAPVAAPTVASKAAPAAAPVVVPVAASGATPMASPVTMEVPAGSELVPLSQMRKTIARRMVEAKQAVPHFYLTAEIDMGPAMALRTQLNDAAAGSVKISVNDLVLKACAAALQKHPRVNASYAGDNLIVHSAVHMGFAAAVEDGLITPTVRDAHQKSIGQIAKEVKELSEKAQAKKLKPEDYTGATFTVSNLGMYGIVEFVAIINPPQSAILAVGAVREIPVVVNGQLAVGKRMRVTLSCDHRVIDGALGAQFLATLRETLEQPMRLLL